MKRLTAILLLSIYLFNLVGYSVVFGYLIQQSEQQFVQQLDQHQYNNNELVEIKIPLNLPYMGSNSSFERLEGCVELQGVVYNYVKRRLYNDTLYILCLPNQQKMQLVKEKSSYAGVVNDFAGAKKEKESSAKKIVCSTEYNNSILQFKFSGLCSIVLRQHNTFSPVLHNVFSSTPGHPPQFVS